MNKTNPWLLLDGDKIEATSKSEAGILNTLARYQRLYRKRAAQYSVVKRDDVIVDEATLRATPKTDGARPL